MREPRTPHGAAYQEWMTSPGWLAHRRRWWREWLARYGAEPVCLVCGKPWRLRDGDLHHRSYDRIGRERHDDLIPLCRPCHQLVHAVLATFPGWWRVGRAAATDTIIARLRALTKGTAPQAARPLDLAAGEPGG
jgi:5-methylcytosine-specific restriction endonuclease McrA